MTEQRIPATVLRTVPYDQMVANLFKHMGSREASLLHAAIGISGETAELLVADSIENMQISPMCGLSILSIQTNRL